MTPSYLTPSTRVLGLAGSLGLIAALAACGSSGGDGGGYGAAPAASAAAPSAAAPSAAAPSAAAMDHGAAAGAASGSVAASDQKSDGKTLVVQSVDLEGVAQGFIGVHKDLDGKPGPVVGVARVAKGTTGALTVTFDQPVQTGAFWPMLHVDDHAIGTYEFPKVPGADLPVKSGGQIVMKKITLTVS